MILLSGEYQEQILRTRDHLIKEAFITSSFYGSRHVATIPVDEYFQGLNDFSIFKEFKDIAQQQFQYDSTLIIETEGDEDLPPKSIIPATFPYIMDNLVETPLQCAKRACPNKKYENLWQIPLSPLYEFSGNTSSSFFYVTDIPEITDKTTNQIYDLIKTNIAQHFAKSRVPFVLNFSTEKLVKLDNSSGDIPAALNLYLDDVVNAQDDAWVLTMHQAIQWMENPTPLDQLWNFEPWQCKAERFVNLDCDIEGLTSEEDEMAAAKKEKFDSLNIQSLFPEGWGIVYWQSGLLGGAYLVIYLFDKYAT